jgi:dipeptidyl aminopeptidase/acylaminoacyl peptidase
VHRTIFATLLIVIATSILGSPTQANEEEPVKLMTPELLWKLNRLGDTALSADGSLVAYAVRKYDLKENKGKSTLFVYDVNAQTARELLSGWSSLGNVQFGKSAFGERLFFTGKSGDGGEDETTQAYSLNPTDGGVLKLTAAEEGLGNLKVSPTGTHIAYTADIKLDDDVNELYGDLPEADARIIDSLMYRHWNAWHDYKYTHLHVAPIGENGKAGEATDLMAEMKVDCPVPPFGGSEQFNWSADGKQMAYTMKISDRWAETTDSNVYLKTIGEAEEAKNITEGMEGYDNDPVFSPDGKYLAFHSMERPGFEADRNRIMLYDMMTGKITEATKGLDQTTHGSEWAPDSSSLVFVSEHRGTNQIFSIDRQGGTAAQISKGRFNWSLKSLFPDGKRALVAFTNMERPAELAIMTLADGQTTTITDVNGEIYEHLELPKVEERWVEATDGKKIHCWVIYPPNFDSSKKYPMLTYFQGGPQGQIGQWFSYRWNFHLMAANDYVIVAPNRRGLPGFGREWNDQISGDWGGQAMQDLLSATDDMLTESYIDKDRVGGIGASFGGYSAYWMMGNHQDRFCSMIAHCGVFNLESMYGSTEELFFVNWDMGGPYWKSDEIKKEYDQFSPHRFVGNWKTPLLVIHGQKDFRVPVTQGMEAFTAAQVQGVPSRFLYYPDEGHWVMGPQNGVLWHRVFFDWLDRHCKEDYEPKDYRKKEDDESKQKADEK